MALQNFVDKVGPVVSAAWLNAVDVFKFNIFADATTKAVARAALTEDAPLEVVNGGTGNRTGITPLYYGTTPAETGAGVVIVDSTYPTLNAKRYGATGDGVTNDHAALTALIAVAKQLICPCLTIPEGTYYIGGSTLNLDVPNGSTVTFCGEVLSAVTSGPAIRLGSVSGNTHYVTVKGVKVRRTVNDTSALSVGVQVRNLVWSKIDIRRATGFQDGIHVFGDQPNGGVSYCEFSLGFLHDNKRGLYLSAEDLVGVDPGYVNENNFYGGSFNHSTGYPAVATVHIEVQHYPTSPLDNNRFFGPSFEDHTTDQVAATINGANNVIFWPRMERSASPETYEIQFTANATECAVLGNGFSYLQSNINDLGSNTCYETREGRRVSHQVVDDAAKAVMSLQSTSSNVARLLRFLDASGNVTGYIRGSGVATLANLELTGIGNYLDDAAAAAAGIAIGGFYHTSGALRIRNS